MKTFLLLCSIVIVVACQNSTSPSPTGFSASPSRNEQQAKILDTGSLSRTEAQTKILAILPHSMSCHIVEDGGPVVAPEELPQYRPVISALLKHGYYRIVRRMEYGVIPPTEMEDYVFTDKAEIHRLGLGAGADLVIPLAYSLAITGVSENGPEARVTFNANAVPSALDGDPGLTTFVLQNTSCTMFDQSGYHIALSASKAAFFRKYDNGWRIEQIQ